VQANFKETQIGHMQPGQRAELMFDSYPDTPIEGRVDSLFAASGAQFSLLPPDNATGNFTKVVQRIPVKLTFAPTTRCTAHPPGHVGHRHRRLARRPKANGR
jgi:membrane fusion protein (multidrug efflux system)